MKYIRLYLSEYHKIYDAIEVERLSNDTSTFIAPHFFRKNVHGFFINCKYKYDGWTDIEPKCKWTSEEMAYKLPLKLIK